MHVENELKKNPLKLDTPYKVNRVINVDTVYHEWSL